LPPVLSHREGAACDTGATILRRRAAKSHTGDDASGRKLRIDYKDGSGDVDLIAVWRRENVVSVVRVVTRLVSGDKVFR
jgi:hypothetical protein